MSIEAARAKLVLGLLSYACALFASACGSDESKGAGYCATFDQRARDCGVLGSGRSNCIDYLDAAETCETSCLARASCAEVAAVTCGTATAESALFICFGRCVGQNPVACQDGRELSGFTRCNGSVECDSTPDDAMDGTDDADELGCTSLGYACRNVAERVDWAAFCDGTEDCSDGSDEPPDCGSVLTCPFVGGGVVDVTSFEICDGEAQCADGSDEPSDCAPRVCE